LTFCFDEKKMFFSIGVLFCSFVALLLFGKWRRRSLLARGCVVSCDEVEALCLKTATPLSDECKAVIEKFIKLCRPLKALKRGGGCSDPSYDQTCQVLSNFVSASGLEARALLRENSQLLFQFHRMIGDFDDDDVDGGLLVRTTVQLNLFGGSIANLGTDEQCAWLTDVFRRGELGSFALTERQAGVLSGLVVECEARVTADGSGRQHHFVLSSLGKDAARKTWISQGLKANHSVVVARLVLADGVDKGPHAFIVDLTSPGVERIDMQRKTAFNSLDNAHLAFDDVRLPLSALLARDCYVDASDGAYHLRDGAAPFNFVKVGQRLLSGRIALSAFALHRALTIVRRVHEYARRRRVPIVGAARTPSGDTATMPLAELPVFADTLRRFYERWRIFDRFVSSLEAEYADVSRELSYALVSRINTAKVAVMDFAMSSIANLKLLVGAYSLLSRHDDGVLGAFDPRMCEIFFLARFAEGDSGALKQKLAHDAMRPIAKPAGLLRCILSLPFLYARHLSSIGDDRQVAGARLRNNLDRLQLALTLKLPSAKSAVERWLASHELVERVALSTAQLIIFDTPSTLIANYHQLFQ
jgi:acyl-CoA oxidase